ncbi:MAG: hypothetical protein ACK4L4_19195 [Gemmobacter sp.]
MAQKNPEFQPGAILHEVIVGAFRARGLTFEGWCAENGMTPTNGRNATFGQSRGEVGQRNLERIIEAAGIDFVRDAYRRRVAEHFAQIKKGVA